MNLDIIRNRMQDIEKKQERMAGRAGDDYPQSFTLSPTCPPSTSVHFTGGFRWEVLGYLIERGWTMPGYTVDLSNPDDWYPWYTYTNAYWYSPCLFVVPKWTYPPEFPNPWPDDIPNKPYLYGFMTGEYETAAEAEDACRGICMEELNRGTNAGGIILRNNGNLITYEDQFMPIDMVNRGRSYLFDAKRYGWYVG